VKRYQVFVSSTFKDLSKERRLVIEALIKAKAIPSAMEYFPASGNSQLDYIKQLIDDCDYYLLIIGARYGSMTSKGVSFTEEEYRYASMIEKPILAFVHSQPDTFAPDLLDTKKNARAKLSKFREEVRAGKVVQMWSNDAELVSGVHIALDEAIASFPALGWTRVAQNQGSSDELANLQSELLAMTQKNERSEATFRTALSAIDSLFESVTVPANQNEIDEWETGYTGERIHLQAGRARIARKDFILKELHGSYAKTVLIPNGVSVTRLGGLGHSKLLFLDGFRVEG
jgi:Domain of unknown function (DUF4062)